MTVRARLRGLVDSQGKAITVDQRSEADIWGPRFAILISLVWLASLATGFVWAVQVLTLIGFCGAVLGLRYPSVGLISVGMLATLDPVSRVYVFTGGLLRWHTFNYWLVIVILLSLPLVLYFHDLSSRLLQVFLILITLEIAFSPNVSQGIEQVLNIGTSFGLMVYFARGSKDDRSYFWLGVVGSLLAAAGGLVFYLQQDSIRNINSNAWAIFPLTGLIAVCIGSAVTHKNRKGRPLLLSLAAINFAWIYLSGSRGTFLIGLCCLVFLFLSTRSLTLNTVLLAGLAAAALWISSSLVEQQIYALSRIERLFDTSYSLEDRTSGRSVIAQAGWNIFLENPLGVGTGGFQQQASDFEQFKGKEFQAHSAWIKTLAENGLPGVILLAAFLLLFTSQAFRSQDKNDRLLGLLVTTAFTIAFLSKEFQGKSLWLLSAGVIALVQKEDLLNYFKSPHAAWKIRKYQRFQRARRGR